MSSRAFTAAASPPACWTPRWPERLVLGVKNDNHRAIGFYTKQGFRQIGTRRFDVGGTLYDDVVLACDLDRT